MKEFQPGPTAERAYRDALGTFGTGVTVVTACDSEGPVGITANSFSSVSLDPPLVLWSVDRKSDRFGAFDAAEATSIHVLSEDQREIALRFARAGRDFDGLTWETDAAGVPLLPGCLARFDCFRVANHDGGDHRILVSRVHRVAMGSGDPLLFAGGQFGAFASGDC